MKVALDTNVMAYAEGANGMEMRDRALELIERFCCDSGVCPRGVQIAFVRRSPRRVYLARSYGHESFCADAPSSVGVIVDAASEGIAGR